MPPLNLPDDFLEVLNSRYNIITTSNAGERKRSLRPRNRFATNSRGLLSRLKRDINVLTVLGPNGTDRADIYLGFILDGQRKYENINIALPDTKIVFYSPPEIDSSNRLIEFDPDADELIYLKVGYASLLPFLNTSHVFMDP